MMSAPVAKREIYVYSKKIKRCLGCFDCRLKTPGKCVRKDDMEGANRHWDKVLSLV